VHWVYRRRKGQIRLDPRDTHHSSDRHRWHRQKRRKTQNNPQIRYSLTPLNAGIPASREGGTTAGQIRPKTNARVGKGRANLAAPDTRPTRIGRDDRPPSSGAIRSNRLKNAPTKRPAATSRTSGHAVRAGVGQSKADDGPARSAAMRPQSHPNFPGLTPPSKPASSLKRGSPNNPAAARARSTSGQLRSRVAA
jgi:hypothetical protein